MCLSSILFKRSTDSDSNLLLILKRSKLGENRLFGLCATQKRTRWFGRKTVNVKIVNQRNKARNE